MSNANDFVIENGVLMKYIGSGGDVIVPEGVRLIDDNAFLYCKSVQTIRLNEGVVRLGWNAFRGCEQLTEVHLPDSLCVLFPHSFAGCISLKRITIPEGVTNLRERVFVGCSNLEAIDVAPDNSTYSSDDGILFDKEKTELLYCPTGKKGKYTIPPKTTKIHHEAFSFSHPELIVSVPDSVTSIDSEAFDRCTVILSETRQEFPVKTPNHPVVVSNGVVFKSLPNSSKQVTALYWLEHEEVFPADASKAICAYIKRARKTLSTYVMDKEEAVLAKFIHTAKPQIEELDRYIENMNDGKRPSKMAVLIDYKEKAFGSSVESDESLTLENKKITLGEMRKTFKIGLKEDTITVKGYKGNDTIVIIPDCIENKPITEIGNKAFIDQSQISEVILPDTITTIGTAAFSGCYSLERVQLPQQVIEIGEKAFEYCNALNEIVFNDELKNIPKFSFRNCKNITSIVFPKVIETIGMSAFADCERLTDLYFSENLKEIARGAFTRCKHITIHAPAGSYAERYAKEHNIPFVAE